MITFYTALGCITFLKNDWRLSQHIQYRKEPFLGMLENELSMCYLRGKCVNAEYNTAASIYNALGTLPYDFFVDGEKPDSIPLPFESQDVAVEEEDIPDIISYEFSLAPVLSLNAKNDGGMLAFYKDLARSGVTIAFQNTLWNEKEHPHFLVKEAYPGDVIETSLGLEAMRLLPPPMDRKKTAEYPTLYGMATPRAFWKLLGKPRPLKGIPLEYKFFGWECPEEYLEDEDEESD